MKLRGSQYVTRFLTPKRLLEIQNMIIKGLTEHGLDNFDAIAFTGMSGALVAPTVAAQLGKTLIIVRKGESCHSNHEVEGDSECKRYAIVDDCICSGETVDRMVRSIRDRLNCDAVCDVIALYHSFEANCGDSYYCDVIEESIPCLLCDGGKIYKMPDKTH